MIYYLIVRKVSEALPYTYTGTPSYLFSWHSRESRARLVTDWTNSASAPESFLQDAVARIL